MKLFARLLAFGALGLIPVLGFAPAPSASAQIPETSYLPVEEPLDVGGTILQPGTYVIQVLPSISNRNILQVTNEDRTKIFATVLSVPHALPATEDAKDTKFIFYPASGDSPRALRTWFNAESTSNGGHDIVYPEERAMQIAAAVKEPVIAYKDDTKVEELKTTPLEVVNADQKVASYTERDLPAKVAEMSEGAGMPRTAGSGPSFLIFGLLALAVALSVRAFRAA
ncbi:MAG: hypothetical protein WC538_03055 [Thermoanaerobaculia bacterium]|jgi:hypothetical protein